MTIKPGCALTLFPQASGQSVSAVKISVPANKLARPLASWLSADAEEREEERAAAALRRRQKHNEQDEAAAPPQQLHHSIKVLFAARV